MSAMLKQKLIDIANGFTKYGLWKGSSKLSELDDVTLMNLQTNDVLTYNGSEWVNDDNLQKQIDKLNSNLNNVFNDLSFTVWVTTREQEHAIKGNYFLYFLVNNSKQLIEHGIFISNSKIVLKGNNVLSLSISNNVLKYKSNSSTGYLSIISMP